MIGDQPRIHETRGIHEDEGRVVVQCIEAIRAATDEGYEYYLQGNIIKYLWRYRYKNGVEDLKKAQWYLNKLIEERNRG